MDDLTRRNFIKTAAITSAALSLPNILSAQTGGAVPGGKVKVGVIGCGGRSGGDVNNIRAACKLLGLEAEFVAVADVFQDRVDGFIRNHQLGDAKGYSGYDGYKKVAESGAEFITMATPPNFRPLHLEYCIDQGKHCFVQKPVAVDPVGARKVIEVGEKAKEKGLSIVAGTQRRSQLNYREQKAKLDAGAIGEIVGGYVAWNGQVPWISRRKEGQSDAHYMTRNWLSFTELSGDHIVEQHVHQLDVLNWFIGRPPVSFIGIGGRARRETGNQFDNFSVDIDYGKGVHVHSQCRQIAGCYNRVGESFRGTEGYTEGTKVVGKDVSIQPIKQEANDGNVQQQVEFIKGARGAGELLNQAKDVADATLMAVGARISSYTGQLVRWSDMTANEKSKFYNLKLAPSALDFEQGTVVLPEEVPAVPGQATELHNRG
jgi:predicted dehydrogenase